MASMTVETLKIALPSRLDTSNYVSDQGHEVLGRRGEASSMVSSVDLDKKADLKSSCVCDYG